MLDATVVVFPDDENQWVYQSRFIRTARPDTSGRFEIAGLPAGAPLPDVLHAPAVRAFFQRLADALWAAGTGSANRPARMHVLAEPPSIDKGEITDKGSINQRAVLAARAALVDALYEGRGSDPFLILPRKGEDRQFENL